MTDRIIAYVDGGSRGNPGPAAAAYVLADEQRKQLQAKAFFIGETTNNVAEYTAICRALEAAKLLGTHQITVYSDSELLVKQLNGQYKIKSDNIKPLFMQAVELLNNFKSREIRHIAREKNKQADEIGRASCRERV